MEWMPLAYLMMLIEFCVSIVGLIHYKLLDIPLKFLVWNILFWFIVGIIERIMGMHGINNLWLMHYNTLIGFAFFIRIYSYWQKTHLHRLLLNIIFCCFSVLWIIAKLTFEPFSVSDDITLSISTILILAIAMFLMIQLLKDSLTPLALDPRFWISSAFIIYSSGTFFIFSLFPYILRVSREVLFILYPINWVLIIISHLLFARAFLCLPKQRPSILKKLHED